MYATVTTICGAPVLLALAANGFVQAYALPSLRQLINVQLLMNKYEMALSHTLCIGKGAHGRATVTRTTATPTAGIYACSASELQRFTLNADLAAQLGQVLGDLFTVRPSCSVTHVHVEARDAAGTAGDGHRHHQVPLRSRLAGARS